tara:strand:- start:27 stop:629 length:603 start_codon:yes stop_codon:yes gene_type:complete
MANYHDIRYNFAIPSDANVGAMTLIKTLTASSDSALSFVNGSSDVVLDSTYKTYIFKFYNIHPATNDVDFEVGFRDGSTAYDATKTDTYFVAYHSEGDATGLTYDGGEDVAQGTGFTPLNHSTGTDNDQGVSGEMWLFSPSSTTYVKHYMSRVNNYHAADYSFDVYKSGYCNVTAAIDAVQFKMGSGNIDSGTIKLYGIA